MSPGDSTDPAQPLLQVQNLHVSFGAKAVVKGLSYTLAAGEKLAIVGESGSGKTLSALALLGLAEGAEVSGHAWWTPGTGLGDNAPAGQSPWETPGQGAADPARSAGERGCIAAAAQGHPKQGQPPGGTPGQGAADHARSAGERGGVDLLALPERQLRGIRGDDIAMVFQEPMTALNPLLTVGEQIAEVVQLKRAASRREAWARAVALLQDMGIPEPARRALAYPHQLSGGQRQRAMIAMALACEPRLLLADEPTTALDVNLRLQILQLMARLQAEQGMSLVLITHDLNLVQRFADSVLVMQAGQAVEYGPVDDVFAAPGHDYTRKLLQSRPVRDVLPAQPPQAGDTPLAQARDVRVRYAKPRAGVAGWFRKDWFVAVQDVSFSLPRAQTLGIIGESGSGKSTLAQAVLGLLPSEGELHVAGQAWQRQERANKPLRRLAQVVFQDPFSSLSPRMLVEELVGEGLIVHEPQLDAAARADRVRAVLAEVGLTEDQFPGLLQRYPHEFSGGQRQRLAIARALIAQPDLLVLDEPTSALDVTVQKQVLSLLQRLQKERGLGYILITHDVEVVAAMAHDVLVMKDGKTLEYGTVDEVLKSPKHPYTQALIRESSL
ncbi:microcin ABC transporter ATP-binding protein [Comamonas serinivorans]|uniref:Microcin ABC transporter ATP-binding protein n=1 Tax=Comamonas serinivorans TaxID=1082851 RepID=A0A1Y0EP42_9BURK|nr:dipeptide ABC transporter ATP-binding protein [Comamonas serinivorans]ARU05356.1 microcin ABC transporter ATP-binding protein [Comamonas serinivorans]